MNIVEQASQNTLVDAIERAVRVYADKTALIFEDREWSYQQLWDASRQVAFGLLEQGLEPGDRLIALGKNSDAYLLTFLACLQSGIIHVPVNYMLTGDELSYIVKQSEAKGVIVDVVLQESIDNLDDCQWQLQGSFYGGSGFDVLSAAQKLGDVELPNIPRAEVDCVQIMYTSGTTSLPKGAMMTHKCLLAEYMSCILHLDMDGNERALAGLPLYHTAQMHCFTMPSLLVGGMNVLIAAPEPDLSLSLIVEHQLNAFFAPPTVWINFLRAPEFDQHDLNCLEKIYYGASIMPGAIVTEIIERLPNSGLYNCYGQTEISPLATVLSPEDHKTRPTSAGRTVINVESRIVDENMNDVAVGERGEIVHRSPQLMAGYWNKPKETAEAFSGGWFHSGDLAIRDEEGYLFIVDRVKDVINSGGVLVASREVEEAIYKIKEVEEVAVIGLPDEKWVEAVTAVIVLKSGKELSKESVMIGCKDFLASYKRPKNVIFVDSLPKNASGKVLKRELRDELAV